ncbi:hypothetical protein [Devosia aurantiaca]|uniref:Uncharacterized protein n=1 Tax=Devosia aurantiaca TaxID=2714858 RepID=A0A6M1SYL0_9HYPH|nr:hypothetical protein [Devosia aurantiaca]NGP19403.1 hypothetical protein [Devosia aurantiaca]
MIGRFVYMAGAPAGYIVLQMVWRDNLPMARVRSPEIVVDRLRDDNMDVRREDEYMSLAVALGYGVLLAGLSGAGMVLSGDRSVWPDEWGELMDMQPLSLAWAKSR